MVLVPLVAVADAAGADEVVLFRFDAVSAARVIDGGTRAGLRCDRVVPAVLLDEPDPGP